MPDIFETYEILETLNLEIIYYKSLVNLVLAIKKIEAEDKVKLIENYYAKIAQIQPTLFSLEEEISIDLDGLENLSQEFALQFDLDEPARSDQDSKDVLELKLKHDRLNSKIDLYKSQISYLQKSIEIYNNNLKIYNYQYQYLATMYKNLKLKFDENFNIYENNLINEDNSRKLVDIQTQCNLVKKKFYQYYRDLEIEKVGKDYYTRYTRRNLIANIIVRAENFLEKFNHYLLIEKKLKLKDLPTIPNFERMGEIIKILKSILTMPQVLEQFYTTSPILLKDNVTRVNTAEDYASTDSRLKYIDTKLINYAKALDKSIDKLKKIYFLISNQYNIDAFSDYVDNTFVKFNTNKRFEYSYKDRYISNLFAPIPHKQPQKTLNKHPQKTLDRHPLKKLNKHSNQEETRGESHKSRMMLSNH